MLAGNTAVQPAALRAQTTRAGRHMDMDTQNEYELRGKLARLKQEHRDLDSAINALAKIGGADQLQLTRLKKHKLQIKDQISDIEDQLFPDIIA